MSRHQLDERQGALATAACFRRLRLSLKVRCTLRARTRRAARQREMSPPIELSGGAWCRKYFPEANAAPTISPIERVHQLDWIM